MINIERVGNFKETRYVGSADRLRNKVVKKCSVTIMREDRSKRKQRNME